MNLQTVTVVPTETVEGYAVALSSRQGILDLMRLKDRDFNSSKVFTLVPESKKAISKYVIIPDGAKNLINQYIPGEITLILPKNPNFKHFYYDHFKSIGIRIPNHPLFPKWCFASYFCQSTWRHSKIHHRASSINNHRFHHFSSMCHSSG